MVSVLCLATLTIQTIRIRTELPKQTTWQVLNIKGHIIDPATGQVDDTEGFGAFDSLIQLFKPECPKNFDNGGGAFDDNTHYLKDKYNIQNVVYDPFMRPQPHNEAVLKQVQESSFDCCTSISVLNVIDSAAARAIHINLCYNALKEKGTAFFKVWPGDKSGIPLKSDDRYQSNQEAATYLNEIQKVFGAGNVDLINEKTIKAIKMTIKSSPC